MKVESGMVRIVRITAVPRLDPIRVTLDDLDPGKGRINIECWGRAWASYWGAMGNNTLAQFFCKCDNDYLIQNLASGKNLEPTRFSAEALEKLARETIRERRRGGQTGSALEFGSLGKDEARQLFDSLDELRHCESPISCWDHGNLLSEIFCEEWWHIVDEKARESNPEYDCLNRICDAVRGALIQLETEAQAEPRAATINTTSDGSETTDFVTRESAMAAIEHVAIHNSESRELEAEEMLVPFEATAEVWPTGERGMHP